MHIKSAHQEYKDYRVLRVFKLVLQWFSLGFRLLLNQISSWPNIRIRPGKFCSGPQPLEAQFLPKIETIHCTSMRSNGSTRRELALCLHRVVNIWKYIGFRIRIRVFLLFGSGSGQSYTGSEIVVDIWKFVQRLGSGSGFSNGSDTVICRIRNCG